MEFFAQAESPGLEANQLREFLTIGNLPALCDSITQVISDNRDAGVIYCVWGEFLVNREELKYGVRFSMPNCPNALAWSITMDADSDDTVIHCTINKSAHDEDFIQSIREFVGDWASGIKGLAGRM